MNPQFYIINRYFFSNYPEKQEYYLGHTRMYLDNKWQLVPLVPLELHAQRAIGDHRYTLWNRQVTIQQGVFKVTITTRQL